MTGNWLENCFIDELLKANDSILLKAEVTIVKTLKSKCVFRQHFHQQTNSSKKPQMFESTNG